jgi:hypothetical protein
MNTGARIRTERRLAAILAADIAGYSRLIGAEEESTLQRLRSVRAEEIDPKIANHRVRLVKTTGIGLAHRIRRRCRCTTLCYRGGAGDASAQLGFRSALTPISASNFLCHRRKPGRKAVPKFRPGVSAAFRTAEKPSTR